MNTASYRHHGVLGTQPTESGLCKRHNDESSLDMLLWLQGKRNSSWEHDFRYPCMPPSAHKSDYEQLASTLGTVAILDNSICSGEECRLLNTPFSPGESPQNANSSDLKPYNPSPIDDSRCSFEIVSVDHLLNFWDFTSCMAPRTIGPSRVLRALSTRTELLGEYLKTIFDTLGSQTCSLLAGILGDLSNLHDLSRLHSLR